MRSISCHITPLVINSLGRRHTQARIPMIRIGSILRKQVCASLHPVRAWFKKCWDLQEKQQRLGLPEHNLIGDVVTRWGSTFDMITHILEQQKALSAVLAEDRKNWYRMIKNNELSVLETVSDILKPLSYFTDILACEKRVTASTVYSVSKHLKKKLIVDDAQDTALAIQIKETLWIDLEIWYDNPVVIEHWT